MFWPTKFRGISVSTSLKFSQFLKWRNLCMSYLGKESSRLSLFQSTKHREEYRDEECACLGRAHDKGYRGDGAYQLVSECGHVTTKPTSKVQSTPGDHVRTVITLKERNLGVATNSLCYRLERVWYLTERRQNKWKQHVGQEGARARQLERPFRLYSTHIHT